MSEDAVRKNVYGTQAWLDAGCPSPLAVNAKDGSVMVYVPAGEFEMGSAPGQGYDDESPQHRVELSAYWIGVYAVSNAQYLKFKETKNHHAPHNPRLREEGLEDHPVTGVSWSDSMAYARWAGCDLASEAQWERACRGPLGLKYPWGNEWDGSKCRNGAKKGNGQTCAVYGYAQGVSGYGTYNQSGNVWEWCVDWYNDDYYDRSPAKDPRGPDGGMVQVVRGGSWLGGDTRHFLAAYRRRPAPGRLDDCRGLRLVRAAS